MATVRPVVLTGQVRFDSHVVDLIDVLVDLVNATTAGYDGTRPVGVPPPEEAAELMRRILIRGSYRPPVTRAEGEAFVAYAAQAREVFELVARGEADGAAQQVNVLLEETQARPRLEFAEGRWNLHFHGPDPTLLRGWVAGFSSGLALALGRDLGGQLGVCAADPCDRVYVDISKNGGRRFCSTRCQSRVKAAAHRSRQSD